MNNQAKGVDLQIFPDEGEKVRAEINLWIHSYDYLFSDFDPRPYIHRGLSDDFLQVAKTASKDKNTKEVELRFLIPEKKRDKNTEALIIRRLKEHSHKHFTLLKKEKKDILKKGLSLFIVGLILMFGATYLLFSYQQKTLLIGFLIVILEPGGWFLFWEGLDHIIFELKRINPDLDFYKKMSTARINFVSNQ